MQVEYTLYEDYLVAQNQSQNIYPKYTAGLSDLLLLNRVIKSIVHNDLWYLPENPEFESGWVNSVFYNPGVAMRVSGEEGSLTDSKKYDYLTRDSYNPCRCTPLM